MRRLEPLITAKDMEKVGSLTMSELRKFPGEVFTAVSLGKRFIVTKNGKPIAQISTIEPDAFVLGAALRMAKL